MGILVFAFLFNTYTVGQASAWATTTHRDIVDGALWILKNSQDDKVYSYFNDYKSRIKEGVVDPDRSGDIHKNEWYHLWKPGPRDKIYHPINAFVYNFVNSMAHYDPSDICYYVGRALHFLQDVANMYHAEGIIGNEDDMSHVWYEIRAARISPLFVTDTSVPLLFEDIPETYFSSTDKSSWKTRLGVKEIPEVVKFLFYAQARGEDTWDRQNDISEDQTIIETLRRATRLSAGFMIYIYENLPLSNRPGGGGGGGHVLL